MDEFKGFCYSIKQIFKGVVFVFKVYGLRFTVTDLFVAVAYLCFVCGFCLLNNFMFRTNSQVFIPLNVRSEKSELFLVASREKKIGQRCLTWK